MDEMDEITARFFWSTDRTSREIWAKKEMTWKDTLERLFATGRRHEPNPLQRAALSALLLTAIMGSVVLMLAVGRWFDGSTPSWLLLASSVPITAVATLMATSHEDKLSVHRLVGPFGVSLAIALSLGVTLGLLWREDGIKQRAITWADRHHVAPVLLGAMQSRDPAIGVLACKKLVESQSEDMRREAFDALLVRPLHFSDCLEGSPLQDEWGKRLVDGWMGSLKTEQDPDEICAWSDTISEATKEVPGASVALLSCALDDTSPSHQTCCMRSLQAGQWTGDRMAARLEQAKPQAIYEQAMATQLTEQLAGGASHDIGMEGSEAMARYAFASSCRSISIENQALATGFANVAVARCQVREKSLRQDPAFWVSVCDTLMQDLARNQDKPIQDLFCRETRGRMTVRARLEASRLIHTALLNRYNQDRRKLEQLAGVIHSAATRSGFVPSDSTGIVKQYEETRYSRSAENQAIHKLGERHIKQKSRQFKHSESAETRRAREEAMKPIERRYKAMSVEERTRMNEAAVKDLLGE